MVDVGVRLGNIETFFYDVVHGFLSLLLGKAKQRPAMPLGQTGSPQGLQQRGRQLQQPQLVGHCALTFAHPAGSLLLRQVISRNQRLQGVGLLHKVQITAL